MSDESDVRGRVLSGARKVHDLVSKTLGPDGQSVLIDRGGPEPLLVDDGRRVAENIKFDDPVEQMTARTITAEMMTVLQRLGFEQTFLDFDKVTGLGVGDNWEKRLYQELSRCHGVLDAVEALAAGDVQQPIRDHLTKLVPSDAP